MPAGSTDDTKTTSPKPDSGAEPPKDEGRRERPGPRKRRFLSQRKDAGGEGGAAAPKPEAAPRRRSRFRKPEAGGGRSSSAEESEKQASRGRGSRKAPRKNRFRRDRGKSGGVRDAGRRRKGGFDAEFAAIAEAMAKQGLQPFDLTSLKSMSITDLHRKARELEIDTAAGTRKQDLVFGILQAQSDGKSLIQVEGLVELMKEGYGFVRFSEYNFLPSQHDVYLPPGLVRQAGLRPGDTVFGFARPPHEGERYFTLLKVQRVNFETPEAVKKKIRFDNLTPLYPNARFHLETGKHDLSGRVLDLLVPIGKGQRGLIVSPPRTGKTMLLQAIANSITANQPDAYLIVLLIDERPEEVTDMKRSVRGEVISSTFDEPASQHVHIAELVIRKAKRLVEHRRDVVILLDSITRLARAYNTIQPTSGKILTGGVDSNALTRPKRFFGAARNVEEGGSLTIVATALVETGSRMDEVIFEEFKGTGNMEAHLDRQLVDKRIFPAIDTNRSGTRKEELLLSRDTLNKVWVLRRFLSGLQTVEAAELLLNRMAKTGNNQEFLASMTQ